MRLNGLGRAAPTAMRTLWIAVIALWSAPLHAESVFVKYHGLVDISSMRCQWTTRSSFVERICYEPNRRYMLVNLRGTYYHYCGVPRSAVSEWVEAGSLGRHYNAYIKGHFDCRVATGVDAPPSAVR
jgi:hypothetical protein